MKIVLTKILLVFTVLFSNYAKADNWIYSLDDAKKLAITSNKLILVDFWANWCGPCKRMDSESWSTDEIKGIMDNYISVQIDIDKNRDLAKKYNVRGIPYIFILDPNGEIVHQQMSYLTKGKLKILLNKYALNTSFLQKDYLISYKVNNSNSNFRMAQSYQNYAMYLNKDIRRDFLSLSLKYLKQTEKLLKKEKKSDISINEKIKLLYVQEKLLKGDFKRCAKELNKNFKEEGLVEKNKCLFYFLNYVSNSELKNDSADLWLEKLKAVANNKIYLRRAEKILGQL